MLTSYLARCSQKLAILGLIGPMTSPEDGCTAWDAISRWRYDSGRVARWKVSSHLYIGLSFPMPAPINPKTYYYGYANSSGFPNRTPSHFLQPNLLSRITLVSAQLTQASCQPTLSYFLRSVIISSSSPYVSLLNVLVMVCSIPFLPELREKPLRICPALTGVYILLISTSTIILWYATLNDNISDISKSNICPFPVEDSVARMQHTFC